ncbi:hypothetical protein HK100_007249, partial [Physocladia obscura]
VPGSPIDAPDAPDQIPHPPVDVESQPQVPPLGNTATATPPSLVTVTDIPPVAEVASIQSSVADLSIEKTLAIAAMAAESSISAIPDALESQQSSTLQPLLSPDIQPSIASTTAITTATTPTPARLTTEFMHPIAIDFSNLSPVTENYPDNPANNESPYNKNNKYSISELSSLNAHQQRMIDLTWADSLVNDMFCAGFSQSDYKMVMAAFHNHCMLVIVTAAVPRIGIDANRVMYYGWKEIRNWVKESERSEQEKEKKKIRKWRASVVSKLVMIHRMQSHAVKIYQPTDHSKI